MASRKDTIPLPEYMDYEMLKKLGIGHIQKIAGQLWTDYNEHDPGVIFLEQLCFALVDLGYRTSFDIKDLLTPPGCSNVRADGSLVPAHEILQCNPTTIEDYRKLVLEHDFTKEAGKPRTVRDITIIPKDRTVLFGDKTKTAGGFYEVLLELEDDMPDRNQMCYDVWELLSSHRNLCEMFELPKILEPLKIGISAIIEIERDADFRSIIEKIYTQVYYYVTPDINLYSLKQLLEKGRSTEKIYSGKSPDGSSLGFIDREELKNFHRKDTLYISDIKSLILKIDGVKDIRSLSFNIDSKSEQRMEELKKDGKYVDIFADEYHICLTGQYAELFNFELADFTFDAESANYIVLIINKLPFIVGENLKLDTAKIKQSRVRKVPANRDAVLPLPASRYRNTATYHSFQNELPKLFKLEKDSLSEREPVLRHAERMQLKAYLLFFDQLLADYVAQLSSIDNILSWDNSRLISFKNGKTAEATYANYHITDSDIADISKILNNYNNYDETVESYETAQNRKTEILNHLLARFNEVFVDYSIFSFWQNNNLDFDQAQSIKDKKAFLRDYPRLSAFRSRTFNPANSFQYSDIEMRIMRKLGIDKIPKSLALDPSPDQSYNTAFGIHLIEHSLLIPEKKFCANEGSFLKLSSDTEGNELVEDPYSFQITAIVPGWLKLCQRSYFRDIVEKIIREEVPAHISVKTCWVDYDVMKEIEEVYSGYLKNFTRYIGKVSRKGVRTVEDIVASMAKVRNIYPDIRLLEYGEGLIVNNFEDMTQLDYAVLGEGELRLVDDATILGTVENPKIPVSSRSLRSLLSSWSSMTARRKGDIFDEIPGGNLLKLHSNTEQKDK